jgi:hypothetical protein
VPESSPPSGSTCAGDGVPCQPLYETIPSAPRQAKSRAGSLSLPRAPPRPLRLRRFRLRRRTAFVALGGVYLGRSRHLGNRFNVGIDGDRWAVVEKYRRWLWRQLVGFNRTVQMALSRLPPDGVIGCSSWYALCHCQIIARAWRWWAREGHRRYGGIRPDLQRLWTRRGPWGPEVGLRQQGGPAALACPGLGNRLIGATHMQSTTTRAGKQPRTFSITFLIQGTR